MSGQKNKKESRRSKDNIQSDYELAKKLEAEERRMLHDLSVAQQLHDELNKSPEIICVHDDRNARNIYGPNLLQVSQDDSDSSDDIEEVGAFGPSEPNNVRNNDAIIARRIQSEFDEESAQLLQAQTYSQNPSDTNQEVDSEAGPNEEGADRIRISTIRNIPGVRHPGGRRGTRNILTVAPYNVNRNNGFNSFQFAMVNPPPEEVIVFDRTPSVPRNLQRYGVMINQGDFSENDYEGLWELAERVGDAKNRGLNKEALEALPTSSFTEKKTESQKDDSQSASCVICLEKYKTGHKLKTLPCLHKYHNKCIDEWLKRFAKCPVCQHEVKIN